jgi:hypothetical protein
MLGMYEVQASKCCVVLPIYKSFNSSFNTFFQFQKPLDLIQKLGSILCTHYILSNARGHMQICFW